MAITNIVKPSSPSLTNISRVSFGELWSTITTTWSAETRSWLDTGSLIDNVSRVSASITNIARP